MNKPNCSTCSKENTKKCPIDFRGLNGNSDILSGMLRVTNHCLMGCHPGAREWLMKDVIKELEHSIEIAADTDFIEDNVKNGMRYAISLIRDGVIYD